MAVKNRDVNRVLVMWVWTVVVSCTLLITSTISSAAPNLQTGFKPVAQSNIFKNVSKASTNISGFSTKASILPGESLVLKVEAPQSWQLSVYKQGYNPKNQVDGNLVYQIGPLTRVRQPAPIFRKDTRTVDASNWQETIAVPTSNWNPGLYVVKLKMTNHFGYIPFLLRTPNLNGKTVYVSSFQTMQAYNNWGGFSAYKGKIKDQFLSEDRSLMVTFNRPWGSTAIRHFLDNELGVARAIEQYGKNIGWTTDFDISVGNSDISNAQTLVTSSHDEYWSPKNRQAYDKAIAQGTNVIIMGGNNSYWRIRYLKSGTTYLPSFYIYKFDMDPIEATSPNLSTKFWRAEPGASPESLLTGAMYNHSANVCGSSNEYDARILDSSWFGFKGTSVTNNQIMPGIATHEMDQILPNSKIPANTQVIMHSKFSCIGPDTVKRTMSYDMVYYTTASNAAVFSAGSTAWGCTLSPFCNQVKNKNTQTKLFVQQVTKNLLEVFSQKNVGLRYPSILNVKKIYPSIEIMLIK